MLMHTHKICNFLSLTCLIRKHILLPVMCKPAVPRAALCAELGIAFALSQDRIQLAAQRKQLYFLFCCFFLFSLGIPVFLSAEAD